MEVLKIGEYEFEKPDFECELFARKGINIFGVVLHDSFYFSCTWNIYGTILHMSTTQNDKILKFNLTPIKKQWHQKKENIGKLCITTETKEIFFMSGLSDNSCATSDRELKQSGGCEWVSVTKCRPMTQNEINELKMEE